jgi:hypothetical protein
MIPRYIEIHTTCDLFPKSPVRAARENEKSAVIPGVEESHVFVVGGPESEATRLLPSLARQR